MKIHNINEGFQEGLRDVQAGEVVLIMEGVNMGEDTMITKSLRGGSMMEVLNKGLDDSVLEANNLWRKRESGREG